MVQLQQNEFVVVLDLDGVILKSNFIKHDAMLSLFTAHPKEREAISAFILANGGVPRKEKITNLLETILHIQATPAMIAEYLSQYDSKLEELLHTAPLVDGVAEFIASSGHTFYVSSSAPESEVESQLARTGLRAYFTDLFGRDTPKATALSEVKRRHKQLTPIFFGDSVGDLRAAQTANVPFVAVVCERDNFPGMAVIKLKDFSAIHQVEQCIEQAIQAQPGLTP